MLQFSPVADEDREDLVDFMFAHAPIMMFPLMNLTRYGLGGEHPRAISAWVIKDGTAITDVLTLSREGVVFPCIQNGHWDAAEAVLKGRKLKGFLGMGEQVTALRQACGVTQKAELDALEPAFLLQIADIQMPDVKGYALRPLGAVPYDLMVAWRRDYEIETMGAAPDVATERAAQQIRAYITTDSHRVLLHDGQPVAMTGFNASLPEIVQVGGVYTPPALRGRGHARRALALHLQEVAVDGVTEAVLSAANKAAARAYTALGFLPAGDFALVIYDEPQVAHG